MSKAIDELRKALQVCYQSMHSDSSDANELVRAAAAVCMEQGKEHEAAAKTVEEFDVARGHYCAGSAILSALNPSEGEEP